MLHRNLLLPAPGAEHPSLAADLMPMQESMHESWLSEDTIQAFLQIHPARPQGPEAGLQARTAPAQHPGWNIAGTGHRAIAAWRSGRRI